MREDGIDGLGDRRHEQHVTVIWRARGRFGGGHAAVSGPVLDDHGLAELLLHLFAYNARHHVGARAGTKADQDPDRSRRILLRDGMHRSER